MTEMVTIPRDVVERVLNVSNYPEAVVAMSDLRAALAAGEARDWKAEFAEMQAECANLSAKIAAMKLAAGEARPVKHKPGCDALGGYGHGVGPCQCGAAPPQPAVTDEMVDAAMMAYRAVGGFSLREERMRAALVAAMGAKR